MDDIGAPVKSERLFSTCGFHTPRTSGARISIFPLGLTERTSNAEGAGTAWLKERRRRASR